LYHFDQFGQRLGFFIFREIPENLKIFEASKSGVRKNQVGQGTAELNEMVLWQRGGVPRKEMPKNYVIWLGSETR